MQLCRNGEKLKLVAVRRRRQPRHRGGSRRRRRPGAVCVWSRPSKSATPEVRHGARGGGSGSPLVIRQHFPLRIGREMGADPCPQTEAGPTAPRRYQVGKQNSKWPLPPYLTTLVDAAMYRIIYVPCRSLWSCWKFVNCSLSWIKMQNIGLLFRQREWESHNLSTDDASRCFIVVVFWKGCFVLPLWKLFYCVNSSNVYGNIVRSKADSFKFLFPFLYTK